MTTVKKIWNLRGDLQIAIKDKDEQKFIEVKKVLSSPGLEFEVMQTKIATKYKDLDKELNDNVLEKPQQLEKLKNNVNYLRLCIMQNRKTYPKFGEEESVLHSIWVLRSKFEKLQHYSKIHSDQVTENTALYEEIMQQINMLLANPYKYFGSFAEHDAMLNIKEEITLFYAQYAAKNGVNI